jgi:ADP-ribose pyrophosphatase YjhB (NUDIX family)
MRTYIPKRAHLIPQNAKKVFSGIIFDIYQWQQKLYDGSDATFEMAKRPDTVNVLAIRDDNVVIVRDEQPGRGSIVSLPAGRHDNENETELEAAKRELIEETGFSFHTWKLVQCVEPIKSTNKIEWLSYLFVALDFDGETKQNLDAGEKIKVDYLNYEEFLNVCSEPGILNEFYEIVKAAGDINGVKELRDLNCVDM